MERIKNAKMQNKQAAIYARVSDKSQIENDKTSISEQIAEMEAYCERNGLTITARYQEVGRGWSKKRPEFQRMLDDAKRGRFDTIICWKSDRLSRGMYPAAALMEVVETYQINLEAVMDAVDMKTFGLMAAIGKIELDNFRERASMGKRGAAKQGRIPSGGVPYGYRIGDDGRAHINQAEATVVKRIFTQYVHEELGMPTIASRLTYDGVPTRKPGSKRWHESYLHRILRNEAYRGTWWYGRTRHVTTEDGRKVYGQPECSWIEIPFPRLVEEDTWARAQIIKKQRRSRAKRNTRVFYTLQHLVRCLECGMLMGGRATRQNTVRRNGKKYSYDLAVPRRYYQCYGMQKRLFRCRKHPFIRAERLEELVWNEVKTILENPDLILVGINALDTQGDDMWKKQISEAERDLQNVQFEENRAIRLYVSGKITEDQLDSQRKLISERLEYVRTKLDGYHAGESAAVEKRALVEHVVEWARKVGDGLENLPDEDRREVLRLLLDRVTIDRDNNVNLTLAIPIDDLVSIARPATSCFCAP